MSRGTARLVAFVALVCLVLLGSNAWWLLDNELPDGFQNEYEHSYTLTEIFFRLRDRSVEEAWGPIWDGYYPPLPHAVASLGLALTVRSPVVPPLALGVFLVLLLGSSAALARKLDGPAAGALAAGLLACYPSVFGNARRYEPNVTLAATVAAAAGLLVARGGLDGMRTAIVFGLLCGLGMLADRLVFAVYLLPIVALCGLRLVRDQDGGRKTGLALWMLASGVTILLCGYYYARFLSAHLSEVTSQLGGEITAAGELSPAMPFWTWRGLLYYPLSFLDCQMGLLPGLATLAGIVLWCWRGRLRVDPARAALLHAWLLGDLLLLTAVGKKQPFYSIPLLAPAAVMAAIGWLSLKGPRLRNLACAALLLAGAHQFLFLTSGRGLLPTPGRWAWLAGQRPFPQEWLGYEYTQAAPPNDTGLRLDRVADLCRQAPGRLAGRPYAMVFSEAHGAWEGQVVPALRLRLDSLLVEGLMGNPPAVQEHAEEASCFVHVATTGLPWPDASEVREMYARWGLDPPSADLLAALSEMEARSHPLADWPTSRGDRVHVFALDPSALP